MFWRSIANYRFRVGRIAGGVWGGMNFIELRLTSFQVHRDIYWATIVHYPGLPHGLDIEGCKHLAGKEVTAAIILRERCASRASKMVRWGAGYGGFGGGGAQHGAWRKVRK